MEKPNIIVYKILALLAVAFFTVGVAMAGIYSFYDTPDRMTAAMNYCVTAVAALLTANLGAVLGIPLSKGIMIVSKFWKPPLNVPVLSCYSYLSVLFLISLFWWIVEGGTEDETQIVSIIPNLGKTFIGIIVGALGLFLTPKVTAFFRQVKAAKQNKAGARTEVSAKPR